MPDLSILIPCKNEEENIKKTVEDIRIALEGECMTYEIIVVSDGSHDETEHIVTELSRQDPRIQLVINHPPTGFGYAIRRGLEVYRGKYVIIVMADASDDPQDIVAYYKSVQKGYDCCFGNRWKKPARVERYPLMKRILNRFGNWGIQMFFGIRYGDVTNAFKCYSRKTIEGIKPLLSRHFNITVELPLKAIIRGYTYTVIPTNWYNRKKGKSYFKVEEMGSRYIFILIYVLIEKYFCGSDYTKADAQKK